MMVQDLHKECLELKSEFDAIKKTYYMWVSALDEEDYAKLLAKINDSTIDKILYKLLKFPGDISPAMLVKVSEALEQLKNENN